MNDINTSFTNSLNSYIIINNGYDIKEIFTEINNIILKNIDLFKRIAQNDSYSFFRQGFEGILKAGILTIIENVYHINKPNRIYYASFFASGINKLYISWINEELPLSIEELKHILTRSCFASIDDLMQEKKKTNRLSLFFNLIIFY